MIVDQCRGANIGFSPLLGDLFMAVQKSHLKSASIPRIEAAVKVYAALRRIDAMRARATKKLRGMLLHPYPRVCSGVLNRILKAVY